MSFFGFRNMQDTINEGFFRQMPRRDQDAFLQHLYDSGYSVPEIAQKMNIPATTIYARINATRGRGPQLAS